jgi:hypothetical protein
LARRVLRLRFRRWVGPRLVVEHAVGRLGVSLDSPPLFGPSNMSSPTSGEWDVDDHALVWQGTSRDVGGYQL